MKARTAPLAVAFREVRHDQPDDCLHHESIAVRGRQYEWTIPAHRHDGLHQLQLLERGSALATLDGAAHNLQAPAALMLAPGCVHAFAYARDTAGQQVTVPTRLLARSLACAPALAGRLATSMVLDAQMIGAELADAQRLFAALAREFQLARPGRIESLQAQALLLTLWFLRLGGAAQQERRAALRDTLVQRFRSLVELHFRRHPPLRFYADALSVTPDHLSRTCRAACGSSALDLVHERMLLESRRLLAYTPTPVADIAQELGFEDAGYFSRFFTRRAGIAPSVYRQGLERGMAEQPERSAA